MVGDGRLGTMFPGIMQDHPEPVLCRLTLAVCQTILAARDVGNPPFQRRDGRFLAAWYQRRSAAMSSTSEYRYNRLTWPEMNEAIGMQKVVLLPTGSTEQHGPHLPLDVDIFLAESVCLEAGRRAPDRVLVLPPFLSGSIVIISIFPARSTSSPTPSSTSAFRSPRASPTTASKRSSSSTAMARIRRWSIWSPERPCWKLVPFAPQSTTTPWVSRRSTA